MVLAPTWKAPLSRTATYDSTPHRMIDCCIGASMRSLLHVFVITLEQSADPKAPIPKSRAGLPPLPLLMHSTFEGHRDHYLAVA